MVLKQVIQLVETLGVPVAFAIVGFAGIAWTFKWIRSNLEKKVEGVSNIVVKRLDENEREVGDKLEYQKDIIIQLINKIGMLQDDIIRLDTLIKISKGLEIDVSRLGKNNKVDENK